MRHHTFRSFHTIGGSCKRRKDGVSFEFQAVFDWIADWILFSSCLPAETLDSSIPVSTQLLCREKQFSMVQQPPFGSHTAFQINSVPLPKWMPEQFRSLQDADGGITEFATVFPLEQLNQLDYGGAFKWSTFWKHSNQPKVSEIRSKAHLKILVRYRASLTFMCCIMSVCFVFHFKSTESIWVAEGLVCC